MRTITRIFIGAVVALALAGVSPSAIAAPGDLVSTVSLPGNGGSVAGSLAVTGFGTHYLTTQGFSSNSILVYAPCAAAVCAATLVATKTLPNSISGLVYDPIRSTATNLMVWATDAFGPLYLIDMGDPTVSGPVVSQTFVCNTPVVGWPADGMAHDASDDTLYWSPDVDMSVYQLSLGTMGNGPACTLLNTISPQNAGGVADGSVSGVAIGANSTLYIGRNGFSEIRHINNPSGTFISQFATTSGRTEDLTCDPVTYAPLEAILSKDASAQVYEAFEVEPGTCPLPSVCEDPQPHTQGFWRRVCKKAHPDQPDRSILTTELCEDMNPDPHSDPCERARSQFAAVLYNLASDRIQEGCIDDNTGNDVGATVEAIEALISEGTKDSCKTASSLAASINEGGVSVP